MRINPIGFKPLQKSNSDVQNRNNVNFKMRWPEFSGGGGSSQPCSSSPLFPTPTKEQIAPALLRESEEILKRHRIQMELDEAEAKRRGIPLRELWDEKAYNKCIELGIDPDCLDDVSDC